MVTSQSTFHFKMNDTFHFLQFWPILQGQDCEYKLLKGVSFIGWLRSAVEIGSGIPEELKVELYSFALRSQLRCSGIWSGCHLDATLRSHLGHLHAQDDSGADLGHTGEIISFGWPGKALRSPGRKRLSGPLCWGCSPHKWNRQKRRIYSKFFFLETHTKGLQQHIIKA